MRGLSAQYDAERLCQSKAASDSESHVVIPLVTASAENRVLAMFEVNLSMVCTSLASAKACQLRSD